MRKTIVVVCLCLGVFVFITTQATAQSINITRAVALNGVAVVQGNQAERNATVTWENAHVTDTNNGGVFSFIGVVPADCVGSLSDGTNTIQVALSNCRPEERVLKTGQTTCYNLVSPFVVINCAGTGQDGELQTGAARSYTINTDGTITDNFTGLIWEKLTNPNDGSIHDYQNFYDWPAAFKKIADLNAANFAGHNDWRLPNINELSTLIDYGQGIDPVFNNGVDSFTNDKDTYFSSTTNVLSNENAWAVRFFPLGASVFGEPKFRPFSFVRAVRGGVR
jgi:hypothetical protein